LVLDQDHILLSDEVGYQTKFVVLVDAERQQEHQDEAHGHDQMKELGNIAVSWNVINLDGGGENFRL
jgi:hypothetical protein